MTQKPKVASSLGMNLRGAIACTSCNAFATSAENMYLHHCTADSHPQEEPHPYEYGLSENPPQLVMMGYIEELTLMAY